MLRDLVRTTREAKGWSQTKASKAAGMGKTWVRDIEDGTIRDPGIAAMQRLAKVLGIPKERVWDSVERSNALSTEGRAVEEAVAVVRNMTPAKRRAFLAANKPPSD